MLTDHARAHRPSACSTDSPVRAHRDPRTGSRTLRARSETPRACSDPPFHTHSGHAQRLRTCPQTADMPTDYGHAHRLRTCSRRACSQNCARAHRPDAQTEIHIHRQVDTQRSVVAGQARFTRKRPRERAGPRCRRGGLAALVSKNGAAAAFCRCAMRCVVCVKRCAYVIGISVQEHVNT